jgi:hypothetical protein
VRVHVLKFTWFCLTLVFACVYARTLSARMHFCAISQDFIDKLIHALEMIVMERQQKEQEAGTRRKRRGTTSEDGSPYPSEADSDEFAYDEQAPISCKEFILAFAHCLGYGEMDGVAEVLEKRASEYRRIGKLFGMEKVQPTFQWSKFWLSFFATGLAFVTFPLASLLHRFRSADDPEVDPVLEASDSSSANSVAKRQARLRRKDKGKSLYDILRASQWLPHPFTTFDGLQRYLMAQWVPCFLALGVYCVFQDHMLHVSLMEIIYPLCIYLVIGMYLATISGYEHPKLQLRRMNTTLSWEFKHNELHAVFTFRAHTPEGHAVDQINCIADVLFASQFKAFTSWAAALVLADVIQQV